MRFTVKELNEPLFMSAIYKLDSCAKYPTAQAAYKVMKATKACIKALEEQRDFYRGEVKKFAQLDEKSDVKLTEDGQIIYIDETKEAEHKAYFDEYMKMEIELSAPFIDLDTIGVVSLSPSELDKIEKLLDPSTLPA